MKSKKNASKSDNRAKSYDRSNFLTETVPMSHIKLLRIANWTTPCCRSLREPWKIALTRLERMSNGPVMAFRNFHSDRICSLAYSYDEVLTRTSIRFCALFFTRPNTYLQSVLESGFRRLESNHGLSRMTFPLWIFPCFAQMPCALH